MSTTKQRILDTSREIFNKNGYLQVTIRQIAMALEMSSGNLNYHFRKREDILEALYFEMVAHFDARVEALPQQEISLPQIRKDIYDSMCIMANYRFFWTDLYQLLQISKAIKIHFTAVLEDRRGGYRFLFASLEQKQLMEPPAFSDEYQMLIDRMINFSNTWLYASVLYPGTTIDNDFISRQANVLLLMLYPYMTNLGKEQLTRAISSDQ